MRIGAAPAAREVAFCSSRRHVRSRDERDPAGDNDGRDLDVVAIVHQDRAAIRHLAHGLRDAGEVWEQRAVGGNVKRRGRLGDSLQHLNRQHSHGTRTAQPIVLGHHQRQRHLLRHGPPHLGQGTVPPQKVKRFGPGLTVGFSVAQRVLQGQLIRSLR